jgi:predicted small secreted protein
MGHFGLTSWENTAMNTEPGSLDMNTTPKIQKIIELKFPITWLLGVAFLICSVAVTAYFKFDGYGKDIQALTETVKTLSAKTDNRDDRIGAIIQSTIEIKAGQNGAELRLARAEADLRELRANIEEVRRNQRWIPK